MAKRESEEEDFSVHIGFVTTTKTYYAYIISNKDRGNPFSKDFISLENIINGKFPKYLLATIGTPDLKELKKFLDEWDYKFDEDTNTYNKKFWSTVKENESRIL